MQTGAAQTLAWLLVREFPQVLMRETTPPPKIRVGTIFATPLANLHRDFRGMPLPLANSYPEFQKSPSNLLRLRQRPY
jgi:hypothetical protein